MQTGHAPPAVSAGPVLVDVPKDVQQTLAVPDWGAPMAITAYMSRLPPPPPPEPLAAVVEALRGAKRPVLYVGGGCVDSAAELREFVDRTGIPVAQTLMGLGSFPEQDPLSLQVQSVQRGRSTGMAWRGMQPSGTETHAQLCQVHAHVRTQPSLTHAPARPPRKTDAGHARHRGGQLQCGQGRPAHRAGRAL